MDNTPRLNLPLLMASQAQKHVTHNEALVDLDTIVQATALSRNVATPPAAPADGATYIVPAGGSWQASQDDIAAYSAGAWRFITPRPGWRVFIADENDLLVFGNGWTSLIGERLTGGPNLPFLGIATSADTTNRLAVASSAALFTHRGADARVAVNKAAAANTASIVFQTGYSGRAEIGTVGSDDLTVKVSADGANWKTALAVGRASGYVGVGGISPSCALEVAGNVARVTGGGYAAWSCRASGANGREYLLVSTDDTNGLGGGRFSLFDQTAGAVRLGVSTSAIESMLPLKLLSVSKAALPSATASGPGAMVYVVDEAGGAVPAFSDGSAWRRVTDRQIVA